MRPMVEKLINKAKQNNYQGNVQMKSTLFTKKAIEIVKNDLVPRFQ